MTPLGFQDPRYKINKKISEMITIIMKIMTIIIFAYGVTELNVDELLM